MMTPIVYGLALMIAAGLVLIVVGLRGKRLNQHPVCRSCGFDLEGVYPAGMTCPECGTGLKHARAVRVGVRRKRWTAAGIGAALVLAPLAMFISMAAVVVSGSELNQYKPVSLLLLEGEHGSDDLAQSAAKELVRRQDAGELVGENLSNAVEAALDLQGNLERSWHQEWGDLIERAHASGGASEEQYQRYLRQVAVIECRVREHISKSGELPVIIELKEARVGSASMFAVLFELDGASVGTQEISELAWGRYPGESLDSATSQGSGEERPRTATLRIFSQQDRKRFSDVAGSALSCYLQLPDSPGAGEHTVRVRLKAQVTTSTNALVIGATPPPIDDDGWHPLTLESRTRVQLEDEPAARLRHADAATTEKLAASLRPTSSIRSILLNLDQTVRVLLSFDVAAAPAPFAFDVYVRDAEREWKAGTLTSSTLVPRMNWYSVGVESQRTLAADCDTPLHAPSIDVILRPNIELAARTIDITEIYGGEIVIEDVALSSNPSF